MSPDASSRETVRLFEIDKASPAGAVGSEGRPVGGDAVKFEVVENVLAPRGKRASLGTTGPKDGKEGFATEALGVHTGEVTQPAEATGAELGLHGGKTALLLHGGMGDSAVRGIGDAQHVPGTAHLEGLEASDVDDMGCPCFRAPKEGGKDSGLENGDFGLEGDVLTAIEGSSESPKALVGLLKTRGDLGLQFRLSGESATEVFEGGEEFGLFGFAFGLWWWWV